MCIAVGREGRARGGSVSHGAGGSEIREELEAQADDKVPDVPGHLRTGDEDAPDQNDQDGVERVANVSQLVQVFACRRKSRELFVEYILLSAHAIILHVFSPVQLSNVYVKYLLVLDAHLVHKHGDVVSAPHPRVAGEVLQYHHGLVQTCDGLHHPGFSS